MEKNKNKTEAGLLPNYFKKVGFVILLLTIAAAIAIKVIYKDFAPTQNELLKVFTMNALILGLLFIAWAKDKAEDEMTIQIRTKSMSWMFIWVVLYVVVQPFLNLLFKEPLADFRSQELVLTMLLSYLILYSLQKVTR
jgi:hypothetical protein